MKYFEEMGKFSIQCGLFYVGCSISNGDVLGCDEHVCLPKDVPVLGRYMMKFQA